VSEQRQIAMLASARAPRLGLPTDTAGMVAFLLSDDAEWFNGQLYVASSMVG